MEYFVFNYRRYDPLPGYDGFIVVELSDRPVRYHIQPTFVGGLNAQECHAMALAACRIACTSTDAVRGKLSVDRLQRAMTQPCLERLRTMQYLLDAHMITHPETKARFLSSYRAHAGGRYDHQSGDAGNGRVHDHRAGGHPRQSAVQVHWLPLDVPVR